MLSRKLQVLLNTLQKLLRKNAHQRVRYIIHKVHEEDLAVVYHFLNEYQQDTIFSLIDDPERKAELLQKLDPPVSQRLIEDLSVPTIVDIIDQMYDDDAADLIQDLPEEKKQAILGRLKKDDREDIRDLMQYDDDTAGGLMTTDFVAVPSSYTAHQVMGVVQDAGEEAEMVFYIYAYDENERLEGVVSLREVVQADENAVLADFMETDIHKVRANIDQEDVAKVISRYDILAVPVVDEENRMLGIVTVDDIIDVIREEATEDILKLVGTGEELLEDYSVKKSIVSRLPWLLATWMGGILVMQLVNHYESQLSQVVALTAFFPIILGMSGNLGQQSATIIVRGLAIGRVDISQLASTIGKEAMTGLIIGLVYGSALAMLAWVQYGAEVAMIPLVVGLSQWIGMTMASIFGAAVPMLLTRFNIDPAVATGPIVTTTLDMLAMWVFMAIASILIF